MVEKKSGVSFLIEPQGAYTVQVCNEEDITWETQNQIHRLLNVAFRGKSIKFVPKTYANVRPIARVLCFRGDELVAHSGISKDIMHIGDTTMKIGCLGLTASINHNKGLAITTLIKGMDYLKNQGLPLAIGVSNSAVMLEYVTPKCGATYCHVPIRGKTTVSKPNDSAIFFPLLIDEPDFYMLINKAIVAKEIVLESEVF